MRTLKFTKMQGAGNDFVMLDGIRQDIEPTPALTAIWPTVASALGLIRC